MRKGLTEKFAVILIGIAIVIIDLWHVITQWIANPPDRYFTGIAHYYADYFLYISQIAQGISGNWIMANHMYTNEKLPPAWIYWPNVLAGRIGSVFTHSPFLIYTIGLILAVILLLILMWRLVTEIFPKRPTTQIVAFFLACTASNFADMRALFSQNSFRIVGDTWFSPTPALNRFGGVPHQTLQTILLLLTVFLYTRIPHKPSLKSTAHLWRIAGFIAVSFLSATLSPIQMLLVCASLSITTLISERFKFTHRLYYLAIASGLASAFLGAFLVNHAFDTTPIFAAAKSFELSQRVSMALVPFLIAMGPIILLIPFGVYAYLRKPTPLKIALLIYGVASLVAFFSPLPLFLGTANVRWLHPASYIIFPLLAAEAIMTVSTWLSSRFLHTQRKIFFTLFYTLIISAYLCTTIPSLIAQVVARSSRETAPVLFSDLNHVPKDAVAAFAALKTYPQSGIVLTDPGLPYDLLVPIFTGKPSFTGHPIHTLYPSTKETLRQTFFGGKMTEREAKQFLNDHRIAYLLVATANKSAVLRYSFVSQRFDNGSLTICAIDTAHINVRTQ